MKCQLPIITRFRLYGISCQPKYPRRAGTAFEALRQWMSLFVMEAVPKEDSDIIRGLYAILVLEKVC
jgi:hypothetical protein